MLFFSSYEYSKKLLVNAGIQDFMAYLTAGLIGDLFASAIYVPSEVPLDLHQANEKVVKVRLQLQGSYNNRAFFSGYNYKSTFHAIQTVCLPLHPSLTIDYPNRDPLGAVFRLPSNYATRSSVQRFAVRLLRTIQALDNDS